MPKPEKADLIEQMLSEQRLSAPTNWIGCAICRQQNSFSGVGHWAWHNFCRAEINPIALIEFIDRNSHADAADRILRYVVAITGIDLKAVRLALDEEQADPARVGSTEEGKAHGSASETSSIGEQGEG